MQFCIDPTVDEPIMLLNGHIGFDEEEGQGISGAAFQAELLALDAMGKKRIQVWINSPGGIVSEGMVIYHAILNTKTKVDTVNCFMACSIAAVIFEAGRTRYMADYALLMFHSPRYAKSDSADDKQVLQLFRNSYTTATAQRTGKTEAEINAMLDRDTWIDATEAVANGFADEIQPSVELNKKRLTNKATATERSNPRMLWDRGNKILASIFKPENNSMKKIAALLGLNEDASENSLHEAITAALNGTKTIQGKFDIQAKALTDMEAELNTAKAACDKLQAEYDDMAAKMKTADEEAKATAVAAATDKSKTLVALHVKAGRVKNDPAIIAAWEKDGVDNYDATKTKLEAIAINASAAKIDVKDGALKPVSAQSKMIEIQARAAAKRKKL